MSKQRGLTDEQKEKTLMLRADGVGFQRIANELGLKRDQVRDFTRTKAGQQMALFMDLDLNLISRENKNDAKVWECRECAITYLRKDSDINSTTYCSDRCKKDYWNRRKRETRKKKEFVCRHCKEVFVRDGNQVYCSDECRYDQTECVVCGTNFKANRETQQETCSLKCSNASRQRTHEQYYKDFSDVHKGAIVPLTMYEGVDSSMTVWCVSCQEKTTGKAREFIRNVRAKGCEHCGHVASEGERTIEKWLDDNEVEYRAEQSFKDLVDIYPLRYDFAILNEDETIRCLIEYDGIQHFEPVETFGGVPFLIDQQKKDRIKNDYAKANGFKLYRISYKQRKNINKILEGILA